MNETCVIDYMFTPRGLTVTAGGRRGRALSRHTLLTSVILLSTSWSAMRLVVTHSLGPSQALHNSHISVRHCHHQSEDNGVTVRAADNKNNKRQGILLERGLDILLDDAKLFIVADSMETNPRPIISDEAAIGSCVV